MKIFVAGATGVIGKSLLPLLVGAGHDVVGLSISAMGVGALERSGVRGVFGDALDRDHLRELVIDERPDIVVHELSDLRRPLDPGKTESQFAANVRLRTEGTRNLVDAAREAGAQRIVAQSYAHIYAPEGNWIKREDDPLNDGAETPTGRRRNVEAIRALEHAVLDTPGIEGVALRYGTFYGPGTAYANDGSIARLVRIRHYPLVGDGRGVTSFIHVDDAAVATLLALEGPTGVFNITDDEPAAVSDWLPFYAEMLGAPAPRHVPAWAVKMLGREHFVFRSTEQRGASNVKAKRELGFKPRYASWRQGFRALEIAMESRAAA